MAESLVEAVLRKQAQKRTMKLRSASGAEVPTDAHIAPAHVRGRATFAPVKHCACGCGRDLDPRNELGLARTCALTKLPSLWRQATPETRDALRRAAGLPEEVSPGRCACGCGRDLDASRPKTWRNRNRLGLARPCVMSALVCMWRSAPRDLRIRFISG